MVDTLADREILLETLYELGIHVSQIEDGFDLERQGSYNTAPGVHTIARVIPSLTSAFRLFKVKYVATNTRLYTTGGHFCGSDITAELVQELRTTEVTEAATYVRQFHARAVAFLRQNEIIPTPQTVGTLMGIASYRCHGTNPGNIAALPHCSGDLAYQSVYLPFLRAGANLHEIVTACAQRVGSPFEITYLMNTTPVRYGVFNLFNNEHTLDNIRLSPFGI